jgi:hypothetical protein
VHLDGAVDHVVQHARSPELDQRDLDTGFAPLVQDVGRIERHETGCLDLGGRFRHVSRPLTHQLEGSLGLAEPAHAVEDPAGPQSLLGNHESRAPLAEEVLPRYADVVEAHLAVVTQGGPHRRHHADDLVAGGIGGNDDGGELGVSRGVGLGVAEHGGEGGDVGSAGEPLVAVDHPLVALESGRGLHQRRVGARHLGLGEAHGGIDVTRHQRLEPALLLLLAPEQVQHDRVLHGERADGHLAVMGAPDHLVHVDEVHERESAPSDLLRVAECPETLLLGRSLELRHHLGGALALLVEDRLGGDHLLVDEPSEPLLELDDFDALRAVRHRISSCLRRRAGCLRSRSPTILHCGTS